MNGYRKCSMSIQRNIIGLYKEWDSDTCYNTGGDLESVPVNERGQTQRPHTVWFHLCEMSRTGKPTETESGYMVAWDWAKTGRGRDGLVGMGVSFRGDENVLELNTGKRLHCECTKCHQSVHFKFYILKWLIYVI